MPINDEFLKELADLLTLFNISVESRTPAIILAEYLTDCLQAGQKAFQWRDGWQREYGRDHTP